MMDFYAPEGRAPTGAERQAFQRLGLTPGHWAALGPAPLFYRIGLRAPNRRYASDRDATDTLRLVLRTASGLSAEAGHFWDRLGDGMRRADAVLATRLLAWHLATDHPFSRRDSFVHQLKGVAEHFTARNTYPPRPHDAVTEFCRVVDAYLPYPNFVAEADPPPVNVPLPELSMLDWLSGRMFSPPVASWPVTNVNDVPRMMPALTYVLGEPVRDWWGHRDPARRAVERGLASIAFEERQRLYTTVANEWNRVLRGSFVAPGLDEFAVRFLNRMREWVDAVRRAARDLPPVASRAAAPIAPEAPVVVAPPTTDAPAVVIQPEFVALRTAAPEAVPPEAEPPKAPPPEIPMADLVAPRVAEPAVPPAKPQAAKPRPERVTVSVAEGFAPVTFDEAMARARKTTVAQVVAWVESAPRMLFDDCRPETAREIAVVRTDGGVPAELLIVGDLHADILALANIVSFAESRAKPAFLFLGDFVDRGIHDHETLLLLFRLMMDHPDRVCVVPGNHDTDLRFDEKAGRFRVSIEPAEYCQALNAALTRNGPGDADRVELARAFVKFCAARPKALFLPDGTLCTHGGFPHTDAQKDIAALADLCQPRCLDDFMWARIAESARVKRPNRSTRGHEFGWDTLAQFCKVAAEKLDLPVKRLVRGHDHVPDRWQEYPAYADNGVPVLTVNAMGRWMDCDAGRTAHAFPVVARYVPGHLPEVVRVPINPDEVNRAFAKPPGSGAPSAPEAGP